MPVPDEIAALLVEDETLALIDDEQEPDPFCFEYMSSTEGPPQYSFGLP